MIAKRSGTSVDEHPRTTQDIVKCADDALYLIKNNGRNGIMAWHELAADYPEQRHTPNFAESPENPRPAG
nr:hypothetical protein [Thiocystis violascens]